jgi:signal transduction histidine kinase
VTDSDLLARLARHTTLAAVPRPELEWLVNHGTLKHLEVGTRVAIEGQTIDELLIVLSGRVVIYMDRGAGRHKVTEWRSGDVTGMLPYSRMGAVPGNSFAEEPTDVLAISREHFPELIRDCHEVTSRLVHVMVDRARIFNSSDLRDERMISLGKMSARLAHELNNPVAAIERNAAMLDERLDEVERTARALGAAQLTEAQQAAVQAMHTSCLSSATPAVLSPLEQAAREEEMSDWLAAHGVDEAVALTLAETNVTFDALEHLAAAVDVASLDIVVRWAAAGCYVHQLASDIRDAAMRIAGLVTAVKGFTHMDQAMVAEPVDLRTSIGNTVTVFTAKAREKAAAIAVTLPTDLPKAIGFVGELNQIWSNLIDNALDAIERGGRVEVSAARQQRGVVVRVIDDGPGIPPEVRARMFEPFFTTKPVGQGTGLGLDIVRRLLAHNDAELEVDSVPGRTEFRVTLPLAEQRTESPSE